MEGRRLRPCENTGKMPDTVKNSSGPFCGPLLFLRKSPAGYFRPPSREKKPKVMGQTMLAKPIARKYSKK